MAKIKVSAEVRNALDNMIWKDYKGSHTEKAYNDRVEVIIKLYALHGSFFGYEILNQYSLIEIVDILRFGYEAEPSKEEKLVKNYLSNVATANFYKDKSGLDKCEVRQEGYSRGYASAFYDLIGNGDIDIDEVIRILNTKGEPKNVS